MARKKRAQSSRDRNRTISRLLRDRGKLSVAELQGLLGVSDMTVRRSLNEMAAEGLLTRTHGGAALAVGEQVKTLFSARTVDNIEYKAALAQEAITFIKPGTSLYLDGGTTCYEISRRIPENSDCFVVTDSIAVLHELRGRRGVETIILGGQLAADDNTVDGPVAAENAAKMPVDICIFSAGSFTARHLQNNVLISMQTKKIMIEKAKTNVCVCDASKYNKSNFLPFCEWNRVSVFLTDSRLPDEARDAIGREGVDIRIVQV